MNRRAPRLRSSFVANAWTAKSDDGALSFTLAPCGSGIFAGRLQTTLASRRVVQSIIFEDAAGFIRWCDADRARLAYPLVCSNLRRRGCELFAPSTNVKNGPHDL